MWPQHGPVSGGTLVRISISSPSEVSLCKFGSIIVVPSVIESDHVICETPAYVSDENISV